VLFGEDLVTRVQFSIAKMNAYDILSIFR
jgi:hypothetical protein